MQVLESGLLQKYGFEKIGVAAHPEAHPDIPQDVRVLPVIELNYKYDF